MTYVTAYFFRLMTGFQGILVPEMIFRTTSDINSHVMMMIVPKNQINYITFMREITGIRRFFFDYYEYFDSFMTSPQHTKKGWCP